MIFSGKIVDFGIKRRAAVYRTVRIRSTVCEQVSDGLARFGVVLITYVALKIHRFFCADSLVRVFHYCNLVEALVKLVALEAVAVFIVIVVGRKVVSGKFKLNLGGFRRLYNGRFGKVQKHPFRLFYLAVGIRRMPVKLNNVLARDTARVGYLYLYGILAVRFKRAGVKPLHVPVEGSVRKPVAEGILHNPVIAITVRVAYFIEITVRIRGFIPFIAEINALLIGQILAVFNRVQVSRVVCLVVVGKGVARSAGGIDRARNNFGNCRRAGLPRYTRKYARLYRAVFLQKAKLDIVADVQDHNYLKALLLQLVKHGPFVFGQLQKGSVFVCADIFQFAVAAVFSAPTAYDRHRGFGIA